MPVNGAVIKSRYVLLFSIFSFTFKHQIIIISFECFEMIVNLLECI